jgi:hypothetical protein
LGFYNDIKRVNNYTKLTKIATTGRTTATAAVKSERLKGAFASLTRDGDGAALGEPMGVSRGACSKMGLLDGTPPVDVGG